MDTVGIILGASSVDIGRTLAAFHDIQGTTGGPASIIGKAPKTATTHAAFINGSLAEVLEMQDGIRYGGVHPSSTVIPAVFALAEQNRLSGKDLILAIAVGYEFLGRFTKLVYPQPLLRGFNMTGVCGAFGAAVGCSKLLGFDASQMANAVGICGLYSPISSRASFYHEIKPTHAGRASEAGLLSALITEKGIQANNQVLGTAELGGICTHLIAGCDVFDDVSASLGDRFELEEVYFKPYPSCRHTHGSIQATSELMSEHSITLGDTARIDVATYDIAKLATGDRRPNPDSYYCTRQFSIPYVVSVSLIYEKFWVDEIFGPPARDMRVYEFLPYVTVSEDPEITRRYPNATPTRVEIVLKDDTRLAREVELPKGDPRNPLSEEEMDEKFAKLADEALGDVKAHTLRMAIKTLEGMDDVAKLMKDVTL